MFGNLVILLYIAIAPVTADVFSPLHRDSSLSQDIHTRSKRQWALLAREPICIIPPYPANGKFKVPSFLRSVKDVFPGERYNHTYIEVVCDPGYMLTGTARVSCHNGYWVHKIAECLRYCELPSSNNVWYYCVDDDGFKRPCQGKVFAGTSIQPKCLAPDYNGTVFMMECMVNGKWDVVEQCSTELCNMPSHHSVDYTCIALENNLPIARPCRNRESPGTTVVPNCKEPNYYGSLSHMHCLPGGQWDYIATCSAECGRITPDGQPYIINGTRAKHGELPWHAGIYKKTSIPYSQICGGSLVSTKAVISAAHCFWDDEKKVGKAELFAVALGKIYRSWNDSHDTFAQHFNVFKIHVPERYRDAAGNFENDIAVVVLETEVVYRTYIRPLCLEFDFKLTARQLQPGKLGKIAGWGLTGPSSGLATELHVVDLPFVPFAQCSDESPTDFQEYITNDKFCAGVLNGTALCQGDSGGGLAFPEYDKGVLRYYLRGIVSTAPRDNGQCDPNVRTTFTDITYHKAFINQFVNSQI